MCVNEMGFRCCPESLPIYSLSLSLTLSFWDLLHWAVNPLMTLTPTTFSALTSAAAHHNAVANDTWFPQSYTIFTPILFLEMVINGAVLWEHLAQGARNVATSLLYILSNVFFRGGEVEMSHQHPSTQSCDIPSLLLRYTSLSLSLSLLFYGSCGWGYV